MKGWRRQLKLKLRKGVEKDLKAIDAKQVERIKKAVNVKLLNDPYKYPPLKGEFKGLRKFRVGDYRVIFSTSRNEVIIELIRHRKDVYKLE